MICLQDLRVLVIETVDELPNYDRDLFVEISKIFSCVVEKLCQRVMWCVCGSNEVRSSQFVRQKSHGRTTLR